MIIIKPATRNHFDKNQAKTSLLKCLTECDKEESVIVVSVNAGYKAKRRLANLGIVPGAKIIKKKSAPLKGPLEIIVKGSSLVIGRGIAEKIMVQCGEKCDF